MKYFLLITLGILASCAQVTSLNLKKHEFGKQPSKIIWLQVAGLDFDHWSMMKFNANDSGTVAVEKMSCIGQAWTYNLYELRPSQRTSMLTQITGKKNMKGDCGDYTQKPLWYYLSQNEYKTVVLENDAKETESIDEAFKCEGESSFKHGAMIFALQNDWDKNHQKFHFSDKLTYTDGSVLFDSTCREDSCYLSFSSSVMNIYEKLFANSSKYLFLMRDFSYQHLLEKNNFKKAGEFLGELDKLLATFQQIREQNPDILILVSGIAPVGIDFPQEGKEWQEFEQGKKMATYRKPRLISPLWAEGARAENFCGFYEETDILLRLLTNPKKQGLELKVINPFAD